MGRGIAQIPNEDPARLGRILDAKWRTIGLNALDCHAGVDGPASASDADTGARRQPDQHKVDVEALKQQAADRKEAERMERDRDMQYAKLANYYDAQIKMKQQEADRITAQLAKEEMDFRSQAQLKDTRREWDLNRPDALLIDQPARIGDDDSRLGASCLQKFDGEDLSAGDRKTHQMQQSKQWLEAQAAEKAQRAEWQRQQDAAEAEHVKHCDDLQRAAMAEERTVKRTTNDSTQQLNAQLAAHHKALQNAEKGWEDTMNNHELESALQNRVLNEDPTVAASALSPFRVRKDHWKGMTPTQRQAIADEQFRQTEELKAKRQAEIAREAKWARSALDIDNALKEQQRMADEFRKRQGIERLAFLQMQAAEKLARDLKLNDTYANALAPEYFSQFGTSHR